MLLAEGNQDATLAEHAGRRHRRGHGTWRPAGRRPPDQRELATCQPTHGEPVAPGAATLDQAIAGLLARGLEFETFDMGDLEVTDQIVVVPDNYPSKGTGERGAFFFDSEGNLLALGQATR